VLALGQPIDAVVEHQDAEVEVAAEHVDQVIASDGERIAVARHDPYRELRPRDLEAGRDGGCATVDGMEAVGVDVVGEAARAADAGDEDEVLARHAELGQELLHLGEDGIVAAARAPAHVLVGDEILAAERRAAHDSTSCPSSPASSLRLLAVSSLTLNGRPWIFW